MAVLCGKGKKPGYKDKVKEQDKPQSQKGEKKLVLGDLAPRERGF
jgi:hypothetical protein